MKKAVIVLGIIALLLSTAALLGFRPFVVSSDAMEPLYHNGDLIIASTNTSFSSISPGDTLTCQFLEYKEENLRFYSSSAPQIVETAWPCVTFMNASCV